MRIAATCMMLMTASPASSDTCRLALAMALDVSGSVDQTEYRLQAEGLATALTDPEVEAALFAFPGAPVAIAVYEWSASRYQRLVQDWVLISDIETLRSAAGRIAGLTREPAPEPTGLGAALEYGKTLLDRAPGLLGPDAGCVRRRQEQRLADTNAAERREPAGRNADQRIGDRASPGRSAHCRN